MDFYTIKTKPVSTKEREWIEISPDFIVGSSKDLMVRGGSFYAIWDAKEGLWSTDEYDVARLVDEDLYAYADSNYEKGEASVKNLRSFDSQSWVKFRKYVSSIANSYHQLDDKIIFSNETVKKEDYASKRLSYPLVDGDHSAWDELTGVLYNDEERAKIEYAIGAVVAGDSKRLQKFLVFYGAPGTGKSTILNVIHKMFYEYATVFEAKALGSNNNAFATEAFKNNPLVAIQHDGDLSKIEDNTKLNSIVAHEDMVINEKYKAGYMARVNAMLFMGTNQPVKISDARSGIIRRLIDVHPTGDKIPQKQYRILMDQIEFQYGAIAHHCYEVYKEMGFHYYDAYRPTEMMYKTDSFFNFVEAYYTELGAEPGITLKRAWTLYKEYAEDARLPYTMQMSRFREELRDYYHGFDHRKKIDGQTVNSWYFDFDKTKFNVVREVPTEEKEVAVETLKFEATASLLDEELAHMPAQYAGKNETPAKKWDNIDTTLEDLNTKRIHFVKVPDNHIVIDFDLKDEDGNKSAERNLEAASRWPATYGEFSKGGGGVHLHYNFDGDVGELRNVFSDGIEIKVYRGDSSLRRRLTYCNNTPVATINGGLPLKEKKMISEKTIKSERSLRELIERNLRKEIHPGTKSSVDFIKKILDDAHEEGLTYDVSDLRGRIIAFANGSTNQALLSLKTVQQMKFESEEKDADAKDPKDPRLVFYDVEVFPNLFVVCWKLAGDSEVVRMVNPKPHQIEELLKLALVGFYNRHYDNHILWAAFMGYSNEALYTLSQAIIVEKDRTAMFGEAYGLSYADLYDIASVKMSLKQWQIELGIHHKEINIPWDQPVPDHLIEKIVEYCVNDVLSTEAVFEARKGDFVARKILADLSCLSVNDTTMKHTARIMFNGDKNPQSKFVYTDLSTEFPGYDFDPTRKPNKSLYRGIDPSEGGYVYSEPGIYENVAVLDVASMHPTSIEQLNLFGEYTKAFSDIKSARLSIKHGDYEAARKMLDGRLKPYLEDESDAKALSDALKIVLNSVYGFTSASFDNPFRDKRNRDNVVAKRGALFMIDLQKFVQDRGFTVAHIKTDSIKIPNATQEIIDEVTLFGEKYGYTFEHEATYTKFCLVNDAVYIANEFSLEEGKTTWTAVGAQFQHPYVYKTLFTGEEVVFEDLCEAKSVVASAIYLDLEHDRPAALADGMKFIGKTGLFVPVREGVGGGVLYRAKDDKMYALSNTKGWLWVEADMARDLDPSAINMDYFEELAEEAKKTIDKFGAGYDEFMAPF